MIRTRFTLALLTLAYGLPCFASTGPIFLPIDMEEQAIYMDSLCSKKAPDLIPSYLVQFRSWQKRLGPYYSRYQQLLYEASVNQFPETQRKAKLEEFKLQVKMEASKRLSELESNDKEAYEMCHMMGHALADPRMDDDLKKLVDEADRNR